MHEFIRWFMVLYFIGYGSWLIASRRSLARFAWVFCGLDVDDDAIEERLDAAVERRMTLEALPSPAVGIILGCASFSMALLAALGPISPSALYALMTFSVAVTGALAFLRLRRIQRRRAALLTLRDHSSGAPMLMWGLVSVVTVLPLLWVGDAPLTAILITAAGVTIALLAGRVTLMPSILSGDDPMVEAFVDARLRRARSIYLLGLAVAPGYVFEAFRGANDPHSLLGLMRSSATAAGLLAVIVLTYLLISMGRQKLSPREVANW